MIIRSNISAVILAGGKSSRMGEDKGLVLLQNAPMLQRILNVVEQFTTDIVIVSSNKEYEKFGYPVVPDLVNDMGPLGGVYTGLKNAKCKTNLLLSCDVPLIDYKLINCLLSYAKRFEAVIPVYDGQDHPLIGIYKRDLVPRLKSSIETGELRVSSFLNHCKVKKVDVSFMDQKIFSNCNTPSDLEEIRNEIQC